MTKKVCFLNLFDFSLLKQICRTVTDMSVVTVISILPLHTVEHEWERLRKLENILCLPLSFPFFEKKNSVEMQRFFCGREEGQITDTDGKFVQSVRRIQFIIALTCKG